MNVRARALLCASSLVALTACYESVSVDEADTDGIEEPTAETDDEGSDDSSGGEFAGPGTCVETQTFFRERVWAPFMSNQCFACHNPLGQAKHTDLVLQGNDVPGHAEANMAALRNVARLELDGESLVLVKARGEDTHGGGPQLLEDSEDYAALQELIEQLEEGPVTCADDADVIAFFEGVQQLDDEDTLRRLTFALASRYPTSSELDAVALAGDEAFINVVKAIIDQDNGLHARIREMFDQTLHTDAFIGGTKALDLLAEADYPTKTWYDAIADDGARATARSRSNTALAREPLEFIRYVIENNLPMTDLVSGQYTVANPYLAQVYGLDTSAFPNLDDANDWRPVRLDGFPHAGLLTMPAYLGRYPTTDTNRNRQRAHVTLSLFLATDVMSLGARPIGTDSVAEHNPTLTNPQCTSCHEIMDPVAGAFQNWNDIGRYRPMDGWFQDMRAPGLGEEIMPAEDYPNSLQWLGGRIANDARFSHAMVDMVFYGLTGQHALDEPTDPSAPDYTAAIKAYHVQDRVFSEIADEFAASGHDFATLVTLLAKSPYFRASNVDGAVDEQRALELADVGGLRLSSPEQMHRKILEVTGLSWLDADGGTFLGRGRPLHLMYGGINSESVLDPFEEVNGVMANVVARMANEMACRATAADFARAPDERVLFPHVETSTIPGLDDAAIEANILYLHEHVLGERITVDDPRFLDTLDLFENVYGDGLSGIAAGDYPATLIGPCRSSAHPETGDPLEVPIVDDPDYTVRAWMAVVSAMLGDFTFLYE